MSDEQAETSCYDVLRRAVDDVLCETLSLPLRATLTRLLLGGASSKDVLLTIRTITGGPTAPGAGLIYLQCEAWIDRWVASHGEKGGKDA